MSSRGHVLTVAKSDDWYEDQHDFDISIECLSVDNCDGWWECNEPHEVDGKSANDGPWDGDDSDPWFEEEDHVFHGVEHTWRYGYGWTVPYEGCVVATSDSVSEDGWDIAETHGPGRYLVEDDWDDASCTLRLIEVTT